MATFEYGRQERLERYYDHLWTDYFGQPTDEYPGRSHLVEVLKDGFLERDWWFPFEILEIAFKMQNFMGFSERVGADSIMKL